MERTVHVTDEENEKIFDLPLEETDGSLFLSFVLSFPLAVRLKYRREMKYGIVEIWLWCGKLDPTLSVRESTIYS